MSIIQRATAMEAEMTMGFNSEWYDTARAAECDPDLAWFAVRSFQDDEGLMWDGAEVASVIGGPFPTEDEALDFAEEMIIDYSEDDIPDDDELIELDEEY